MEFIDSQRFAYSDLADKYGVIGDLHSKKLWHQLSIALLEFVRDASANRGDNLIQLYEKFVSSFEGRLNQLQFVLIVAQIAAQYYPSRPFVAAEIDRAIAFLLPFLEKKARLGSAAYTVLALEITALKVKKASSLAPQPSAMNQLTDLLDECKKELETAKEAVDALPDGEDPVVPGTYYRVASEYYKLRGPAHSFYESALLYLGHTPLESLAPASRHGLAVDVALAALVGEGVFNFGEVNAQPILASLAGTPQEWLRELLAVFQTGNIDGFNAVVAKNKDAFGAQPALLAASATIKEKITLLAVMEMAASRPATDRSIPFVALAQETRLPVDQVEWVLMRAMSLGLIKGRIDQVDSVVHITFVKPRVLDKVQVAALQERVENWRQKAHTALVFMEEQTQELLS